MRRWSDGHALERLACPHRERDCLGHFVARSDMSVALPLLARRLRHPRIDGEVRALPMSGNTGFVALPVGFEVGVQP